MASVTIEILLLLGLSMCLEHIYPDIRNYTIWANVSNLVSWATVETEVAVQIVIEKPWVVR